MNEILRKVKCSERLPIKQLIEDECNKYYIIKIKDYPTLQQGMFIKGEDYETGWYKDYTTKYIKEIEYWYEPIEIELKSEEILHLEERTTTGLSEYGINQLLKKYDEALEVAELELVEYKAYKKGIMDLVVENQGLKYMIEKGYGDNCVIAPKSEVDKIAKERYDKAYKIYSQIEEHGKQGLIFLEALEIAAGIE